jgi:glycosyltransferase involved in cell wall biosynthesis
LIKILLLGNINSIHAKRWAIGLANRGLKILFFSLSKNKTNYPFEKIENIQLYCFGFDEEFTKRDNRGFSKWRYLKVLPTLRAKIKEFNPDILHAHYVSGYGTIGALSCFHPFIVSVWGSDIFDFPHKSFLHKKLIEFNLKKADKILSTSNIMAQEISKYTDKNVEVIPFGIDSKQFKPMKVKSLFDKNDIVIGTVKSLEIEYGIDYLIKSFKYISDKYSYLPLKLLIVGDGKLKQELQQLVIKLDISDKTIFTGKVDFKEIPKYHNMLSIFVALSNSESFGVAVIEASSCERAVVVSNVGGLPEVVQDGITGFIVSLQNEKNINDAIEKLILDEGMRKEMGQNGRDRTKKIFNWENNLTSMIKIYRKILR